MRALFLMILLMLMISDEACADSLSANLDRQQMHIGESVHLELKLQGSSGGTPDLSPLTQDFEIVGQQQSSSIQIINGQMQRSTQWQIELMPRHTGRIAIPPIRLGSLQSQPLDLQVLPEAPAGNAQVADDVFLNVQLDQQDVYVQQQVVLSVQLFRAIDLAQAQLTEPDVPHATVQRLGEDANYKTTRNGRTYIVTERRYVIFPQQHGDIDIPALRLDARTGGGIGLFARPGRMLRRFSQAQHLHVRPIPAQWPQGYDWLPAKHLQLSDSGLEQADIRVGDALTRTIRLQADGLMAAQLPDLPSTTTDPGLKSYPDRPTLHNQQGKHGIIGWREQKIALMPTQPGTYTLPAIRIPWWDTTSQRLQWAELPARQLQIKPAATAHATPPVMPTTKPAATMPSASSSSSSSGGWRGWFWLTLLFALAWLITLACWLYPRWQQKQAARQQLREHQQCEKTLRRQAIRACETNQPDEAAKALLRWSAKVFSPAPVNLLQLADVMSDNAMQWRQQLSQLDRYCYDPASASPWQGRDLAELLKAWKPRASSQATSSPSLPPLYPDMAR